MHLVSVNCDSLHVPLYKEKSFLSRPASLSGIFHNLRIHRNITRKSLALRFDLSEQYVSSIEDGRKFGSLRFFLKCAEFFGANPNCVKCKWANESVRRYGDRLRAKLCLDNQGFLFMTEKEILLGCVSSFFRNRHGSVNRFKYSKRNFQVPVHHRNRALIAHYIEKIRCLEGVQDGVSR